jgi:diguanylate cyclase
MPLTDQVTRQPIAVLELYLPYRPIAHEVTAGLDRMYLALVVGLGVRYLTLFAISISVSRGLRRESVRNAFLAELDALTELPNRTRFRRRR